MFRSLKGSLLAALVATVLLSCLLVAVLASQRYAVSLEGELRSQAEILIRSMALQASDLVLVNDRVSLHKLLQQKVRTHPSLAYAFVVLHDKTLTHTFEKGVPLGFMQLAAPGEGEGVSLKHVKSEQGRRYLHLAAPMFDGKAGVLHVGFDEEQQYAAVRELWVEAVFVAVLVLVPALVGGVIFIRKITHPITTLANATQRMAEGDLDVRVPLDEHEEIAQLAGSFNTMAQRLKEYTHRLEKQAADLEVSNHHISTAFEIIRGLSEQSDLTSLGRYLLGELQKLLRCQHMALFLLNSDKSMLFMLTRESSQTHRSLDMLQQAENTLKGLEAFKAHRRIRIEPPLAPPHIANMPTHALAPISCEGETCGGLVIGCSGDCACDFHEGELISLVLAHATGSIIRAAQQEEEVRRLRQKLDQAAEFSGIVGKDAKMQTLFALIENVAPTDATVLIQGESGTGKELVAKAIHEKSLRYDKPFVVINCSAYPETLLESELFGYEKGAFTGALKRRLGRFEQADGGTVFLDEIGEVPLSAQVKLLRALQTRQLERLGSEITIPVDVRIIAATNKDLLQEIKTGAFREDLYYRLDVVSISLPPLRERGNDTRLLAQHFLESFAAEQGKQVTGIGPRAMRLLLDYDWPGNVRELENVMEQSVVVARASTIHREDLPSKLQQGAASVKHSTILDHERNLLLETLEECNWNKSHAAERLGIGRSTLYAKLRKFRITSPDGRA